jgi:hypothetical protein
MQYSCISFVFLLTAVDRVRYVASNIIPTDVSYTAFDSASWAIMSNEVSPILGTNKQALYDDFIRDCNFVVFQGNQTDMETNSVHDCASRDKFRQRMNRIQPTSVYNYTKEGYKKIKAPPLLMDLILEFWHNNREKSIREWKDINIHHNTWDSPVCFGVNL